MQPIGDSEVEQWVLRELQLTFDIGSKEICVFCCDGVVTLRGTVHEHNEKSIAHEAAAHAPGVLRVINRIRVSEPANVLSYSASNVFAAVGGADTQRRDYERAVLQ